MIDPKRLTEADRPKVKPDGFETATFGLGVVLLFVGLWRVAPELALIAFGLAAIVIGVGAYHLRRTESEQDGGTEC